jgi:hypothetical protein
MNMFDAEDIFIERSADGAVSVKTAAGQAYKNVAFTQLFPQSDPNRYITMRYGQGQDFTEIGILKETSGLPEPMRRLIEEDIQFRYFVPQITDIVSITSRRGVDTWVVETDRGKKTFTVQERGENVVTTDKGIVFITDADRCRYKIADINRLPFKSRDVLEKVLM